MIIKRKGKEKRTLLVELYWKILFKSNARSAARLLGLTDENPIVIQSGQRFVLASPLISTLKTTTDRVAHSEPHVRRIENCTEIRRAVGHGECSWR